MHFAPYQSIVPKFIPKEINTLLDEPHTNGSYHIPEPHFHHANIFYTPAKLHFHHENISAPTRAGVLDKDKATMLKSESGGMAFLKISRYENSSWKRIEKISCLSLKLKLIFGSKASSQRNYLLHDTSTKNHH